MSFQTARREETQSYCLRPGSLKVQPTRSEQGGWAQDTAQVAAKRRGNRISQFVCTYYVPGVEEEHHLFKSSQRPGGKVCCPSDHLSANRHWKHS